MSLQEKLNKQKESQVKREEIPVYQIPTNNNEKEQELLALLKETKDLNDLMRGYIRTNMDKSAAEKLTFDNEIDNIKGTSKKVTDQMLSILTKQENLLNNSVQMLQKVLTNSHNEMKQNNNQVLQEMKTISSQINEQMNEIKNTTKTEMESIRKKNHQSLNELSQKTSSMVSNARKEIWMNDWLDVVKYGLGTAVFVVPVYVGVKFLFGLFGVEMP